MNDIGNLSNFNIRHHKTLEDDLTDQFDPKTGKGLGEVTSTLVSLGSQAQTPASQYQALASRPTIPNPDEDQLPLSKDQISSQVLKKVLSLKNPLPNASADTAAFEEQLNAYAQQNQLSQEEVVKLRFAFYNPDATEDPQTKEDAQNLTNAASQQVGKQFNLPNNYQINPNTQGFKDAASGAYVNAFEAQLAQLAKQQNLTPAQVNQVRYAFYNPGTGSPPAQQMSTQLQANAAQVVQQQFGLPPGTKPPQPDNTDFNAKIVAAFDEAFENTLQNQVPPLTETQKGLLKFMFYNPETSFPGSKELEEMLHTMQLNTLNALKSSLGLPPGVQPQPATQYFNSVLSSAYQVALKEVMTEFLGSIKPPMNKKDQELLERALENPDDPSVPDEIKQIAAMLQGKGITSVKQKYNLPSVWSPSTLQMKNIPNNPATTLVQNGVNYLNDFASAATSNVLLLPASPEKNAILDFLKIINDALSNLKQFLYQMTSVDSAISKKITSAKMEDQQQKMKFFQQAQEAAEHASSSGGKGGGKSTGTQKFLSIFMKIIIPVVMVATLVITAAIAIATCETGVGPVVTLAIGISIMAALTALMIADSQTHCISKFFDVVSEVVSDILPSWVPTPVADLIDITVKVTIILGVLAVCCIEPAALLTVGLGFGMQALMDSGIVQETIAACGGNQQAQVIGSMVVGAVLAITIGVLTLAAGGKGFITGFSKVGEESAELSQAASVTEKVTVEGVKDSETMAATVKESETEESVLTENVTTTEHAAQDSTAQVKTVVAQEKTFKDKIKEIFQEAVQNTKEANVFIEKIAARAKDQFKFIDKVGAHAMEQYKFLEKLAGWAKEGIDKFISVVGNKTTMDAFTFAQVGMDAAAQGAQIAIGIQQMKLHMQLAALALLEGNLDAAITQVEALINRLSKMIELLLDGLSQATSWISDVSQMQNQIWQGASTSMTKLVHATARAA